MKYQTVSLKPPNKQSSVSMGDLRYRQMTAMELIQAHFSRYEIEPSEKVLKSHVDWAMRLDQKAVEYALDPRNHPHISGSVPRPKLPTLMRLAFEGTRQEPKVYPKEEYYRPIEEPIDECMYCVDGEVHNLVWRDKWEMEAIGQCKHCSSGDAECHPGIVAVSQRWQAPCVQVIFKTVLFPLFMVGWDGKSSLEFRKAGRQEAVNEFLDGLVDRPSLTPVGLPEYEGTKNQGIPF